MSEEELIAAVRNTYGGSVSAKTLSRPKLLASLVNAAGGTASAATHSEDEMLAGLATALGASNWSASTKAGLQSLAEAVSQSSGGGGGGVAPEWVPEGFTDGIYIDFAGGDPQSRAWVFGSGEVAVDTLLGADSNAEGIITNIDYEPEQLVTSGYRAYDAPGGATGKFTPALIGAARTMLLAGATVRIRWYATSASGSGDLFQICNADGSNNLEYYYTKTEDGAPDRWFRAESWAGGYGTVTVADIINKGAADSLNCFVLSVNSTRSDFAVNGSDVQEGTLTPETHWNDLVAAVVGVLSTDDVLLDIAITPTIKPANELSALSVVA